MFSKVSAFLTPALLIILLCSAAAGAAGMVNFQIEVIPGFTVEGPEKLVFEAAAPGGIVQRDLMLTVWSNVTWELLVKAYSQGTGDALQGQLECCSAWGSWDSPNSEGRSICKSEMPTGEAGYEVGIPFRFVGSYDDLPGDYTVGIEITVVPML